MIVMINGPFGVGKSTVAQILYDRLPNAMLYDPEIVGAALRALTADVRLPEEQTDDFQDLVLWPKLTVMLAEQIHQLYRRDLIVPMTVVHPDYFATICQGLRSISPPLHHFCLTASAQTIQARLIARGDDVTGWAWRKSQQYIPQFADPRFQIHIDTEKETPEAIAQIVLDQITP